MTPAFSKANSADYKFHFLLSTHHLIIRGFRVLTSDVQYKMAGREKALYLDVEKEVDIPSMYLNPKRFTLLFWMKPVEFPGSVIVFRFSKAGFSLKFRSGKFGNAMLLNINGINTGSCR